MIGFINDTDLASLKDHDEIINAFLAYGKNVKQSLFVNWQSLKLVEGYQLFIDRSIQRGYAENSGADLDSIIPQTSL